MKASFKAKVMRWLAAYARVFHRFLPSPFAIALVLTAVAGLSSLLISGPDKVLQAWSDGLWNPSLMRFGFQAMFMLVLGHVLALSAPVKYLLDKVVVLAVKKTAFAPAYVAFFALMLGSDELDVVKIVAACIIFIGVYLVGRKPKALKE